MLKQILWTIPKTTWFIFCIMTSLILACVSGYFTYQFYTDGSSGYDIYAMGFMAISLEVTKFIFSVFYPFAKYRNKKSEDTILWIMKICLFLSILSSMYCLMLGKDLMNSPASKTVLMLYEYMPVLNIIPIKFAQFISTISLVVLIEFLIVFLPTISTLMFQEKDYNRKTYAVSNIGKIKEILVTIPELYIDRLYLRFMNYADSLKVVNDGLGNVTHVEEIRKPKLKLLKNDKLLKLADSSNVDWGKSTEDTKSSNEEIKVSDDSDFVQGKDKDDSDTDLVNTNNLDSKEASIFALDKNTEKFLKAIFELASDNICPSQKQLSEYTGYTKNDISSMKKLFEDLEILKTDGLKTTILCGYLEAIKKLELVQ